MRLSTRTAVVLMVLLAGPSLAGQTQALRIATRLDLVEVNVCE